MTEHEKKNVPRRPRSLRTLVRAQLCDQILRGFTDFELSMVRSLIDLGRFKGDEIREMLRAQIRQFNATQQVEDRP